MSRKNRLPLTDRVTRGAEAELAARKYVSTVDVLLALGWLDPNAERRWRQGSVESLEAALQVSPERLAEAIALFRSWATAKGLIASEAEYVARTPQRPALRFSRSGDPSVERQ